MHTGIEHHAPVERPGRRTGFGRFAGLLLVSWLAGAASGWTQEKRPPAQPATNQAIKPPLRAAAESELPGEVKPDVFLLPGKDGKLQSILGFPLEEFTRLYNLKNQLDLKRQRPSYTIRKMTVTGTANAERAELEIEFAIVVRDDDWVRVPLRLAKAILKDVEYQGPGEQELVYVDDGDGYVSWIHGKSNQEHRVIARMLVPLSTTGGETQLKLSVPRATASQMKLEIPADHPQVRVPDDCDLQEPKPAEGGKTQLSLLGVGGEFQMAWREADSPIATVPVVLEASGALLARIDGRSVNTEARLTVRSFGGQFDRFRVRLPPGADLAGANQPGVSVTSVAGDTAPDVAAPLGKLVEVKLEKKTTGPVEVRLVTERPHNPVQTDELLELAGFEVLGAARQWGSIAVQVVGNWQVAWGENRNVRQVDEYPESLRREDVVAGFEYYIQPCSLSARVLPQKTRIRVHPEYLFLVGAQQAQLSANLKYTVRGAKVRSLDIELPGWKIDAIGPANLVNADALLTNDGPAFSLLLLQPSSGEFELTLEAHRSIDSQSESIELDIPHPLAETIDPATVVVLPADNVELNPKPDELLNLSPQPLKPQLKFSERQSAPLQVEPLAFRSDNSPARFVAGFKVHAQSIATEAISQIDVDEQEIRVEQQLTYQVAYEPVEQLALSVPQVISPENLRISVDGQKLSPVMLRDQPDAGTGLAGMRVQLPNSRIGRCELQISYALPREKPIPAAGVSLNVPLVMPVEGKLTRNHVFVTTKSGMTVSQHKGPWNIDSQARPPASRSVGLALSAAEPTAEVALDVVVKDRQVEGSTIIERGWIQTWLSDSARQDRVVYRFTTSEQHLALSLPEGILPTAVNAYLDGARLRLTSDMLTRQGHLSIPLPTGVARDHLLELNYRFKDRGPSGTLAFAPPQCKPAVWVRRLYWQVILPAQEHMVLSPGHFTGESVWTWSGFGWERRPLLEQADLESWSGAASSASAPEGSNRYLFSTVGSCEPLQLWTARRPMLVFAVSLAVLSIGLLVIYLPSARSPGLLLVAAVALAGAAAVQPDLAVLVAQAASLGVALVLLALGLAARGSRTRAVSISVAGSSQARLDRSASGSATEMYYRASKAGSPSSTATAPVAAHSSSLEPKP